MIVVGNQSLGGYQEKHRKQVLQDYADLGPHLLIGRVFLEIGYPYLPGTEGRHPLQMKISLINVNISYRRATATQFQSFTYVCFYRKNNQQK